MGHPRRKTCGRIRFQRTRVGRGTQVARGRRLSRFRFRSPKAVGPILVPSPRGRRLKTPPGDERDERRETSHQQGQRQQGYSSNADVTGFRFPHWSPFGLTVSVGGLRREDDARTLQPRSQRKTRQKADRARRIGICRAQEADQRGIRVAGRLGTQRGRGRLLPDGLCRRRRSFTSRFRRGLFRSPS